MIELYDKYINARDEELEEEQGEEEIMDLIDESMKKPDGYVPTLDGTDNRINSSIDT